MERFGFKPEGFHICNIKSIELVWKEEFWNGFQILDLIFSYFESLGWIKMTAI